jgi:hypothetical protein
MRPTQLLGKQHMKTSVKSLRDLHKLKVGPVIQIQRAGKFYKARYAGAATFVFGSTAQEARGLLKAPSRSVNDYQHNAMVRGNNWAIGFREGKAA